MLTDIHLYGAPARALGYHFRLDIETPVEAFVAIDALTCGKLTPFLRNGSFSVVEGALLDETKRDEHDADSLTLEMVYPELHIIPEGEGSGGKFGIILGAVIFAVAIAAAPATGGASVAAAASAAGSTAAATGLGATAFTVLGTAFTYGHIALMGAAMFIGGIAQLLAPTPKFSANASEDKTSHLYGPVNSYQEGGTLVLAYGRVLMGSTAISTSIRNSRMDQSVTTYSDTDFGQMVDYA